MKKIIVLYGRGDIGKTSTLRMVTDMLEGKPLSYSRIDVREVYSYNEKKVVVTSYGDTEAIMIENIAFMKAHPFDVAITAARSYGRTHDKIKEYANASGCELVWLMKSYEDGDENAINKKYADKIIALI